MDDVQPWWMLVVAVVCLQIAKSKPICTLSHVTYLANSNVFVVSLQGVADARLNCYKLTLKSAQWEFGYVKSNRYYKNAGGGGAPPIVLPVKAGLK